jgi:hypothetical protein
MTTSGDEHLTPFLEALASLFRGLIQAGFNEDQAMQLLCQIISHNGGQA